MDERWEMAREKREKQHTHTKENAEGNKMHRRKKGVSRLSFWPVESQKEEKRGGRDGGVYMWGGEREREKVDTQKKGGGRRRQWPRAIVSFSNKGSSLSA